MIIVCVRSLTLEELMGKKLFVDMDGTLAEFKVVDTLETLYEEGYFLNLKPHENVVGAVKEIISQYKDIEVYILSAFLTDSEYALSEKNKWLDKYLPEVDPKHRLFCSCGKDKNEFISYLFGNIGVNDFLLDDYSVNLHSWEPPARGIKLMNGINGTNGTWTKEKVSYYLSPADLAENISNIVLKKNTVQTNDRSNLDIMQADTEIQSEQIRRKNGRR